MYTQKHTKAPWIISPGCFCCQEWRGISGRLSTPSTDHNLLVRLVFHCSNRSIAKNCSIGRLCGSICVRLGRKKIHERKISTAPKYIGWRTLPYMPSSTCLSSRYCVSHLEIGYCLLQQTYVIRNPVYSSRNSGN